MTGSPSSPPPPPTPSDVCDECMGTGLVTARARRIGPDGRWEWYRPDRVLATCPSCWGRRVKGGGA